MSSARTERAVWRDAQTDRAALKAARRARPRRIVLQDLVLVGGREEGVNTFDGVQLVRGCVSGSNSRPRRTAVELTIGISHNHLLKRGALRNGQKLGNFVLYMTLGSVLALCFKFDCICGRKDSKFDTAAASISKWTAKSIERGVRAA